MISTKQDLEMYLKCDFENNYYTRDPFDCTKKYITYLRKYEYYLNSKKRIRSLFYKILLLMLSSKKLTYLPANTFGPGLSIGHFGCIYVNSATKIGKNCRIHQGVTIGATNGSSKTATIGDNVFIGSGAMIIGDIVIADDVAIAAGAVVVKDILEPGTTWGGNPARKISNNNSHSNIKVFSENDLTKSH